MLVSTNGLHVIQQRMPTGAFEQRHVHRVTHQFYFLLQGVASVEIDGIERPLRRHEGIEIPAGLPHQLRNTPTAPLEFLVISTQPPRSDRTDLSESCDRMLAPSANSTDEPCGARPAPRAG